MSTRTAGRVKFFNEEKGYGFIIPEDGTKDVFVHRNDIIHGHRGDNGSMNLGTDDRVSFVVGKSDRKKGDGSKATLVKLEP